MKRQDFLRAVERIMPGIDESGSPLGMDFVVMDKGYLRSYNDTISVSVKIDELPQQYLCAVKAQEFYRVLSHMDGERLKLSLTDTELVVQDRKTTLRMTLKEPKQLNLLMSRIASLSQNELKWVPLPSDCLAGLDLCAPSLRSDPALGILSNMAVAGDKLFATDNLRASLYRMKEKLSETFLISSDVVKDIVKYGSDSKSIAIQSNWVHFTDNQGLIISARRSVGEYPVDRLVRLFDESNPAGVKPYCFPEGLDKALDRAAILAQREEDYGTPVVSLRREGRMLVVRSGRDVGRLEDRLVWENGAMPEDLEILIAPDFLKKILKITREFKVSPNKNAVLFEAGSFLHLMAVRIGSEK